MIEGSQAQRDRLDAARVAHAQLQAAAEKMKAQKRAEVKHHERYGQPRPRRSGETVVIDGQPVIPAHPSWVVTQIGRGLVFGGVGMFVVHWLTTLSAATLEGIAALTYVLATLALMLVLWYRAVRETKTSALEPLRPLTDPDITVSEWLRHTEHDRRAQVAATEHQVLKGRMPPEHYRDVCVKCTARREAAAKRKAVKAAAAQVETRRIPSVWDDATAMLTSPNHPQQTDTRLTLAFPVVYISTSSTAPTGQR